MNHTTLNTLALLLLVAGSLTGCAYSTALLATYLCVRLANHLASRLTCACTESHCNPTRG